MPKTENRGFQVAGCELRVAGKKGIVKNLEAGMRKSEKKTSDCGYLWLIS